MKKTKNKTLFMISTEDIAPNPHNPRLIFDMQELDDLKRSIGKVGILVPLTIYANTRKFPKIKYILLDGERRWRCAQELGLPTVPANVIDEPKDITQNILFMFNIHHFRREWELFPTALKLDVLIKRLNTGSETTLANFTGVNRSMIRRCKKLLWYPNKYRDVLMEKQGRISTDFFIELYPVAYRLSQELEFSCPSNIMPFIDSVINKFLQGQITDVKEFREMRKCMAYHEEANDFKNFIKKIKKFINISKVSLEIFAVPDIEENIKRKNIMKYMGLLNENIRKIDPGLISDIYFMEQLKRLHKTLGKVIDQID